MRLFSSSNDVNALSIVSSGSTKARGLPARFSEEVNVLDFGAQGDGVTDDAPAFTAAIAALYARKGGRLVVPPSTAGYALAAPIVVDPSQYSGGNGMIVDLNGNTFLPSHNGWCFDLKTNYFGSNNGGLLGKKLLVVKGDGAVIVGTPGGAGGLRATDTIAVKIHDLMVYSYPTGWGVQLNVSTTNASTWTEESDVYNCRASGCLVGFGTYSGSPNSSFLGTKFHHCIVEGRVNNCTLFWLQGGPWNSTFVSCGGFYNQNGATGGRGFMLDGSFAGTTFISAWVDTGVDSTGSNPSTQSPLSDIVFGPNYTPNEPWLPTFIGSGEINLPPDWRTRLLLPGPFPYAGSAGGHMSANPREMLRNPRTYYVATSGSDSNDGLSPTTAFATPAHALDVIYKTLDLASLGVTVQLADGTYTSPIALIGVPVGLGTSSLVIQGNVNTPGAVTIAPSSGIALSLVNRAQVVVQGITLQGAGDTGVSLDGKSSLTIGAGCQFGACANQHIFCVGESDVVLTADLKLTGDAPSFLNLANRSGFTHNNGTIDATGRTFSANFTNVHETAVYTRNGGAYTTTGSKGGRYFCYMGGIIQTFGAAATLFPGDSNGYADSASGGYYK